MRHLTAIACLLAPATLLAAPPNLQEGQWQITTRMQMEGMPANMPPHTLSMCLNKDDIARGDKTLPQAPRDKGQQHCEFAERSMNSAKLHYKMVCTGDHRATMTGDIHYESTRYDGKSRMEMVDRKGKTTVMTQEFSAQRLGDCRK
ncbi:DUF3617 family protein [Chitinivorax sp. PXF-14]|uniref:DUF3617 domain-containing protein n=1 Tax=Chitinivorax sp. PXF-14 TaxID=3230488 RepID=UPI003466A6CF